MSELSGKYPRSLPHRPPEEVDTLDGRKERPRAEPRLSAADLAALEARLRLRLLLVILASVAVLVVIVLVGVFYVNQAVRRAGAESRKDPENRVGQEPRQPEPMPAQPGRIDRTAEVLGGLTAAHLHQTYLNIGLLADATENDVYTAEESRKLLETVLSLIVTVDRQLAKLPVAILDGAEQKKLVQARQVVGMLRTEAKQLQAYWDTPEADKEMKKEREADFHKARQAAWEGIKELVGISD